MSTKYVKFVVPIHVRDFLFAKPHGTAYRKVLLNYNLELEIPLNPKDPILLKGMYPDLQYGSQELTKHIQHTIDLEFNTEVIISNKFAKQLKTYLKKDLEKIEIDSICFVEVFETHLLIHSLEEELIRSAKEAIDKLFSRYNEEVRKAKKGNERNDTDNQILSEVWYPKDMRRPSHNVI